MNKPLAFVFRLIVLFLVVGCQDTPTARKANEKARKEIGEAGDATAKALQVQREEYRKKIDADLERLDAQLDTWKAKAKEAKGDAQVAMQKKIDDLKVQRDKVADRLKDLKVDSKEAWEDFKTGTDKAVRELKEALDKAKDLFK